MDSPCLMIDQRNLLSTSLTQLRIDNILTDVQIECKSGVISAHGAVLAATSSYFKTLLLNDDDATDYPRTIQFHDYSKDSMEIVISFLYGCEVFPSLKKNQELIREVLSIAHILDINALLKYTWDYFIRGLSLSSYSDVWYMAKKYDQITMQEYIFNFMLDNLGKLLNTEIEPDVFNEMMKEFITYSVIDHSSDSLLEYILKWGELNSDDKMEDLLFMVGEVDFNKISNCYIHELLTDNAFVDSNPNLKRRITEKALSRLCQRVEQIHVYCYNDISGEMSTQMFCLKTGTWYDKKIIVLSTKTAREWHQIKSGSGEQYYFAIAKDRRFVVYDPDKGKYYFGPTTVKCDAMGIADGNDLMFWDYNFTITRFNTDNKKWFVLASLLNVPFLGYPRHHSAIISAKGKLFLDFDETDIIYSYSKNINKWRLKKKPYCNLKIIKNASDNSKSRLFFLRDDDPLLVNYDPDSDEWEESPVNALGNLIPICMNTNQTEILCYENINKFDMSIYDFVNDVVKPIPSGLQLEVVDWEESDISLK